MLRGVFKLAGRTLKTDNPMDSIENSKHQAPPPDPLSSVEMELILADMRKHYDRRVSAYFEFMFMTGPRPEEAIALRRGDVDWNAGTIRVERARSAGEEKALKTYNARDVDLVERAIAALEVMKPWTSVGAVTEEDKVRGHCIFENPITGRTWHDERSQRDTFWRPTLRRCGCRGRWATLTRRCSSRSMQNGSMGPTGAERKQSWRRC